MSEWLETRIGDVADINTNSLSKDYPFEEIEYIDISSVDKGELLDTQELNLKEAPSRARRIVNKDDILISTVRPNLEHYYYVKNCKENTVASTGYAVITAKKINPQFLYYLLTRKLYTNYLTLIADGHTSTYPAFNPDVIEDTFLPIPDISEQNQIVSILSSLDSKIDILRRQNQTLENIAQTLFKHWFVDFEFSDKDGKPYKSSGGKMVESELGGIPDGWWVGLAGNFIKVQGGYAFKSKDFTSSGNNGILKIRNIQNQVVDINNTDFIDNKVVNTLDLKFKVNSGDMLIAMTGAEVAKIGIVANNSKNLWLNQRVGKFCENIPHGKVYIYFLFIRREYQNILKSKGDGSSAQPNISSSDIEGIEIIIPSEELVNAFSRIGEPIYETISQNLAEIETLTKVRDTLLPKLMSGQIRVKNL